MGSKAVCCCKVETHLLGWNLKCLGPHVNLLIHVNTGNDKEHPRTPGPSCQQSAQSEDDCPLILLMASGMLPEL